MKRPMYHSLEINKANEELAADNLRLSQEVESLRTRVEQLQEELHQEKWNPDRIVAWMDEENRKPAIHAFTAGGERQIAYRVERLLANPITQDTASPKASNSTTVPDHSPASLPESESASVHQPDVQAADAMLRSVSLEMSAWLKVNPNATATHACFELMRRVESTLAASPVQPEVSKEQDNAEGK